MNEERNTQTRGRMLQVGSDKVVKKNVTNKYDDGSCGVT